MAVIFTHAFCPSSLLPASHQEAAEPEFGQSLAAGMVQGSQQRCYHPVSSPVCWLHHPISAVIFLSTVGQ